MKSTAETRNTAESAVFDLYRTYPFPQTTAQQRKGLLAYQLCKYKYLGVQDAWRGRVLDVGCGTGRTMLVPKHYSTQVYVGMDQSEASLSFARQVAREDNVPQFVPIKGDLYEMPFSDGYFDLVVSWGVLHCTADPMRGLREMSRVCKPGGFVAFMVYNPYAHWLKSSRQWRVRRKAGSDVEARLRVAHRLYGKKPIEQMTPQDIVRFVDTYCVPIESKYSYGKILSWLNELGLEFWGNSPPLRIRDFVRYLQTMADLMDEHPVDRSSTKFHRLLSRIVQLSRTIPIDPNPTTPLPRPSILHRAFWQSLLVLIGARFGASSVSSFSARKPLTSR